MLICFVVSCEIYSLEFSSHSITAFDRLWNGLNRDDSIVISNKSHKTETIDSIFISFDNAAYNQFDIGWIEKIKNQNVTIRRFTNKPDSNISCHSQASTIIAKYNSDEAPKISIAPKSSYLMQSPYISETCSMAGMFIDCLGGSCFEPYDHLISTENFAGQIIFVSSSGRDTLLLNCTSVKYITAIRMQSKNRIRPNNTTITKSCNLLGKTLLPQNKLEMPRFTNRNRGYIISSNR